MSVTITIDSLPVEVRIVHYLPPEPPRGLYGHSMAPDVAWVGPDWLNAVADHFNLWSAIDKMVLDAIADSKQGGES